MLAVALVALAACPSVDARQMLRAAGQGLNGRVLEVRDDRVVVEAESRFDAHSIKFGQHVTVFGRGLPATVQGRIGLVVRRRGGRWVANRCDVVPGARMALAIGGDRPCPAPRVRISGAAGDRRSVTMPLTFDGDVTGLRVSWNGVIERRTLEPGVT